MATKPSTFLTKTVRGVRKYVAYYDPDIFDETIILSASLLIGANIPDGTPDVPVDDISFELLQENGVTHYNTIHDEPYGGTAGTNWLPIEQIAIPIYPKPKSTKIIGAKNVEKGSTYSYHINPQYDPNNLFTYQWDVTGTASINGSNLAKTIILDFGSVDGKVTLKCKITNPSGCLRYIIKNIYVGLVTKEMLIVRNTYF